MKGSLARRLAVAVTVVIVIVDIVLIGTAVRSATGGSRAAASASAARTGTVAYPAPEMITPTRRGVALPTTAVIVPGASPALPEPGAVPASPTSASPTSAVPTSTAPTPEIAVLGESRTVDEPEPTPPAIAVIPAPLPPAGDSDTAAQPLLAVAPGGVVIRATRGRCPADGTAVIELSPDLGRTWTPLSSAVAQVLGVDAARGELRIVATDRSCRPIARHSTDGGASWQAGALNGIWYLSPDAEADQVLGPALVSTVGCVPRSLAATDDDHAAVVCADGTVRVTDDAGDRWDEAAATAGVLALSGVGAGHALARVEGCAIAVLRTAGGAVTGSPGPCLDELVGSAGRPGADVPAAIAAAGAVVVAQVGSTFLVSTDSGATWSAPAP